MHPLQDALALMKEGGSVVFVVHDDAMIEYVADIAFRAAGDFLFRAEVRKDHRGPLIIRPQDCPAELRIQNARIGVGRDHTHILVDHMVRGEL